MKNKKLITLLVCLAMSFASVGALSSCGNKSDVEVPEGMKEAYSEEDIFYLFIPSSWTYERGFGMPYAYFSATDTSNVSVMLYMLDSDVETTTAVSGEAPSESTSAESTDAENPKAKYINAYWSKFTSESNNTLPSFAMVSQGETTLNNYYAQDYVYTHKTGGVTYKHRAVVTYYGEMIVCFTYSSTEANYDKHIADVDDMLANFAFKK